MSHFEKPATTEAEPGNEFELQVSLMTEFYEQKMNEEGKTVSDTLSAEEQREAAQLWNDEGMCEAFRKVVDSKDSEKDVLSITLDEVRLSQEKE